MGMYDTEEKLGNYWEDTRRSKMEKNFLEATIEDYDEPKEVGKDNFKLGVYAGGLWFGIFTKGREELEKIVKEFPKGTYVEIEYAKRCNYRNIQNITKKENPLQPLQKSDNEIFEGCIDDAMTIATKKGVITPTQDMVAYWDCITRIATTLFIQKRMEVKK